MKDVVTGAHGPVLVTGFGSFPGAPDNPTLDVLRLLAERGVDDVALRFASLPVTFAGVACALRSAAACRPSAILLMGLARRRTVLSVERFARNRAGTATPDNDGTLPMNSWLVADGPERIDASWPATAVRDALVARGYEAALSDDAGDYVCNAALYHALHDTLAPAIGFLHVPPVGCRSGAPTIDDLAEAARVAVATIAAAGPRCYAAASAG